MTKAEFVQRAAIALAGNPRFTSFSDFSPSSIVQQANRLAEYFELNSEHADFDDMSDGEYIADKLGDIEEEMEREFDIEHDIK